MRLNESTTPYLEGTAFTDSLMFDLRGIGHAQPNMERLDYLRSLVRGKDVLDVGCVGHLPLIESQRKSGRWLHEILCEAAKSCAGIDIDRAGCEYLVGLGFGDVFCSDIVADELPAPLRTRRFDFVILGETLEHVDDPVAFLTATRLRLAGIAERLVITTPNAFRLQNMIRVVSGHEVINSDHRYWFSPYSLAKVMWRSGFSDIDMRTVWVERPRRTIRGAIKHSAGRLIPAVRDCLIADARFNLESS